MYHKAQEADLIFSRANYLPEDLRNSRLREEVLGELQKDAIAYANFKKLSKAEQEAIVEFCMGNRGLKITFDPFFHKILKPEKYPERLEDLLSSIVGKKVTIKRVLPREGIRLSDGASLMIMDVLVQLEDKSMVNVEIQRHGYYFPVNRSFCYGSDIMVRQYAELRDIYGKKFSYDMMNPVYIIVLMENSPAIFHKYPETYIHRSKFSFDSGMELGDLLNFIYIPLDIFANMPHNEIGKLEAWLYFLGSDNPINIQRVIKKYPFFGELYKEIIEFQYNPKELIGMFSEALAIMDRNTINLMIDDMKKEAETLKDEIKNLYNEKENILEELDSAIAEKDSAIAEKDAEIERLKRLLEQRK